MEFLVVNLKYYHPSSCVALANVEIEIENAIKAKLKAIKFIHGYCSHGIGGKICQEVHRKLIQLKKQGKIKNFILGSEWNISNEKTLNLLFKCPTAANDEDLNHNNNGITIVVF